MRILAGSKLNPWDLMCLAKSSRRSGSFSIDRKSPTRDAVVISRDVSERYLIDLITMARLLSWSSCFRDLAASFNLGLEGFFLVAMFVTFTSKESYAARRPRKTRISPTSPRTTTRATSDRARRLSGGPSPGAGRVRARRSPSARASGDATTPAHILP